MVDPIATTALVAKTGQAVVEGASDAVEFFDRTTGGIGDLPGNARADGRLAKRVVKQVDLLLNAQAELRAKGIDPRIVKWNVVFPLLDAAALEDDKSMSARWQALLTNATDPNVDEVPPSFPDILRALTPNEAKLLDYYYETTEATEATEAAPAKLRRGRRS
jgi:hypothetical protein